ncbi:MaoC/PaaZ C-terminal domain-containing protein [Nocardia sp. R7R-8]|uniref:MaoC/PaaZ C-terminal domain-containing protein n=1 Tax=Nocardia sp. R7R-8 TaxID=3459304 RepID=UPI00403D7A4C
MTKNQHIAPIRFDGLESLQSAVGTHLGESAWREVDQAQVNTFADLTADHQWIHVDVERAAQSPLGATLAHGFLTLGMVPAMAEEVYLYEGFTMSLNYGANKLRFPSPLHVGSRVRGSFELAAVTKTDAGYLVQVDVTVEVEGFAKPACYVEWLVLLVP